MEEPTTEELKKDIIAILQGADLTKLSSKKVRLQLSEKHGCDLQHRKDEIDNILMDEITNEQNNKSAAGKKAEAKNSSASSKSKSETSKIKSPAAARPPPNKTSGGTKKSNGKLSSDEDQDSNDGMVEDAKSDSDDEVMNDEDLARKLQEEENRQGTRNSRQSKNAKSSVKKEKTKKQKGDGPKRTNKYNELCNLSPALADVMGQDKLPRHEVVKRVWAIVKERNLYDPKNKQYMLCDDQMLAVFGRKRVRTFGMMKYLSQHIISPSADQ